MNRTPTNSLPPEPVRAVLLREGDFSKTVSILAVIVLFNKEPRESLALNSLLCSAIHVPESQLRLKILLYDNTPGGQAAEELPEWVEYVKAPGNNGISFAYNEGLKMAISEGFEWLLTLDHDTTMPEGFLERVSTIVRSIASCSDAVAVVPEVSQDDFFISPNIISRGRLRRLPNGFSGFPAGEVAAVNSATTWRVSTWREFGGFSQLFWLDYLDFWAFHVIHLAGNRVYVAGDLQVQHELSLLDPNSRMAPDRFENFMGARSAFCDLYGSATEGFLLTVNLAAELCKQTLRRDSIDLRRLTWKYLWQRIILRRTNRIDAWKRDMMSRMAAVNSE